MSSSHTTNLQCLPGAKLLSLVRTCPETKPRRICAKADIRPDTANLGYKLPCEAKTAAPHALKTREDFSRAIADIVGLIKRARTQPQILTIINLAPLPLVAQPARKANTTPLPAMLGETASEPMLPAQQLQNFRNLKEEGNDTGEHFALTIQFLIWWVQQITKGEATLDKPSNAKQFDLKKRARTTAAKQASTPIMPSIVIQNQIPTALGDATNLLSNKRKRASSKPDSSTDSDDKSTDIGTLLTKLNDKYPALKFHQYKDSLEKSGIAYTKIAANFDEKFFKEEAGMAVGAVSVFLKGCKHAVKNDKARPTARESDSD
ncbi:hypothetical protein FRC00_001649 [Tulasnella sp. 408]|nr:hypothetical protein FRC00_001649 [Tulasnella sp. 408]